MTEETKPNTAVAVKPQSELETVRAAFQKMKPQFEACLPKHITPDRLMRVAMTAIQNTPKLLECDRRSLYSAVMKAAQLGLEPDGILGQAYLIPYGKTVQFIPGYKGLIDLARRSGEVSNIIAKEVCKNDDFKITWHEEIPFRHEQTADGDRGDVIGFWALARFKDGGFHWDYMTRAEVEAIRNSSSGWQQAVKYSSTAKSPWGAHFVEMGKKTAIRRIAKYLPMSVQKAAAFDDAQDRGKEVKFEHGDLVIEGDAETLVDEDGVIIEGDQQPGGKLENFAPTTTPEKPKGSKKKAAPAAQASAESSESTPAATTALPDLSNGPKTFMAADALAEDIQVAPPEEKAGFIASDRGQAILAALRGFGYAMRASEIEALAAA